MQRLEAHAGRAGYALLLLAAAVFVAIGVWIASRVPPLSVDFAMGVVCIVFFGLGVVVFLWQLLDPRPRLVIDDTGVLDRTLGVGRIPWRDIRGADLRHVQNHRFVALDLRDPQAWLRRMPAWRRLLARANRSMGFAELNLNLSGLAVEADDVLARLREGIERARP